MLAVGFLLALAAGASAAPATTSSSSSAPPSSPSLTAAGFTSQKWIDGFKKAQSIVAGMTFEEKVNFTTVPSNNKGCSGHTAAFERIGFTGQCLADGPTGINSKYSSQFPAEVTTAATFDPELFTRRAEAMGQEYHDVGIHIPLSIVAGPMGRSPYGGRNWENWSPDPYLTGVATRLTVKGFQKNGVIGQVKHFVGNEQEYLRIGNPQGGYTGAKQNQSVGDTIDGATLRELYTWGFSEAVREGSASIMCSYNLYHGTSACENDFLLNELLKEELNFLGTVCSDWGAAFNTVPAALNGTDITMPSTLFGARLAAFVQNGTVPDSIFDDKIIRTLTPYFALDQAKLPEVDFTRYVASQAANEVIRDIAEGSLTLLKNVRSEDNKRGLPLNKPRDLTLVGSGAGPGPYGLVSNTNGAFYYTTGRDWPGFVTNGFGSGGQAAPYAIDPFNAITARGMKEERPVFVDGYLSDDPLGGTASVPGSERFGSTSFIDNKLLDADTAIVFVSTTAMEGYDRVNLSLSNGGDDLIKYVAERHNDTVVVVTAPGPVDMSQWIDSANVTAVIYAHFPSVQGGPAIASVLFGDVSPSGKLPFTIANKVEDYNDARYTGPLVEYPVTEFTEGPFIDYRYFDAKNITPLYEFGFGKSYSTFSFADLRVAKNTEKRTALVRETNEVFLSGDKTTPGLYDRVYTVKAVVKNTGSVAGAEVAQLYLSFPSSTPRKLPIRQLRGFTKSFLKPGQSKTVEFELRNKDLAYYDVEKGGWVIPEGEFTVSVGSSSRKLPLTGTIKR
ncbi:hypothetical protein JCM6882_000835 [Rhodosporidiobolus microsporus]